MRSITGIDQYASIASLLSQHPAPAAAAAVAPPLLDMTPIIAPARSLCLFSTIMKDSKTTSKHGTRSSDSVIPIFLDDEKMPDFARQDCPTTRRLSQSFSS
ncbi:hypothetical protein OH77DRAFT_1428390 [Trametes cingulata]|nr:hypothetical protein OH77DRAFT_1428390 [Trametes cingulata]